MANAWYDGGLNAFGKGEVIWKASGGSTVEAILVDSGYTYSAAHTTLTDIGATARHTNDGGSAVALTLIDAASGGVLDASDISFTGLTASPAYNALVIYKRTSAGDGNTTLLLYIDTGTSGLPTSAGATQVNVVFDSGTNKVARL
jgi:hypothetical protein